MENIITSVMIPEILILMPAILVIARHKLVGRVARLFSGAGKDKEYRSSVITDLGVRTYFAFAVASFLYRWRDAVGIGSSLSELLVYTSIALMIVSLCLILVGMSNEDTFNSNSTT